MTAHTTIRFGGLDAISSSPSWYRQMNGSTTPSSRSFADAVELLHENYRAQERPVAYWDEDRDEWVQTDRHVAIVNPALLGRDPSTARMDPSTPDDACWNIPTRMYDVVNPQDAYDPLVDVLRGLDATDVFGEVRTHRWGGEVHLDLFVPAYTVTHPDTDGMPDDPKLVLGLTTGYDFFGGHKLYAEVIAGDPVNESVMRGLTDPEKRRHAKSRSADSGETAATVADWWETIVEKFDVVTDALFEVIYDARKHTIDLTSVTCEPVEFFTAMGAPSYVAEEAVDLLDVEGALAPPAFSAWQAYRAYTRALTTEYRGKTGGRSMRGLVRVGNDLLNRPAHTEAKALDAHADRLDNDQMTFDDRRAQAAIRERATTVREDMDEYDSLKARMKAMLKHADADDDSDTDTDADANGSQNSLAQQASAGN